jgi:hypothetical protein
MAQQSTAKLAFERAWSVYLLITSDVNENDERRSYAVGARCEFRSSHVQEPMEAAADEFLGFKTCQAVRVR